jgi:hypothetical protein
MKYYLHDTNAMDDEKVTELYMKFGYEGVGLFYVILEKLGKQEKPMKTKVLKSQLKIGKRLEKCWKFMEEIGIISSNNGETFNKQLLNFSEKYQIKKEKTREKVAEWRKKQDDSENVTSYVPISNPRKVKLSKVKLNKVKNNKKVDFDFDFVDIKFKTVFMDWINYKKARNQMYKTQQSLEACYRNLLKFAIDDPNRARQVIDQSMGNNYDGLFPLREVKLNGKSQFEPQIDTSYIDEFRAKRESLKKQDHGN